MWPVDPLRELLRKISTPRGNARSMRDLSSAMTPYDISVSYTDNRPVNGVNFQMTGPNWMGPLPPMQPIAPPQVAGRAWDFIPGYNLNTRPRAYEPVDFGTLRMLAEGYDPLRLIIERRKDQMTRLPWAVRLKHDDPTKKRPKLKDLDAKDQKLIAEITQFFRKPDRQLSFRDWLRLILEDHFVIDAPTMWCERNRGGDLIGLRAIDGSTIKRVIDDWGRTPEPILEGFPFFWNGEQVTAENFAALGFKMVPGKAVASQLPRGATPPASAILPPAYQQCYASDTEVLTNSGWKKFQDIKNTDKVATRNPSSKTFEWQNPTAIIRNRYRGKMYGFKSRFLDILVTPEHRMLVSRLPRDLGGSPYRERGEAIVTAEDLAKNYTISTRIPLTSEWVGSEIESKTFSRDSRTDEFNEKYILARALRNNGLSYEKIGLTLDISTTSAYRACKRYVSEPRQRSGHEGKVITMTGDDYAAFMGAYLSEGSCNLYNGRTVCISQTPYGKALSEYQNMLDRIAPSRAQYYEPNFVLCSSSLVDYLRQFGHARTKWIPDEIMNATRRQLEIFWRFFWLGDGDAERQRVFTSSRRMADQLQEIAQKLGLSASIRVSEARTTQIVEGNTVRQISSGEMYTISILPQAESAVTDIMTEDYDGDVWCVSVPNTIIYVRRNGKAAWCGNCLHGLPAVNYTTWDLIYKPSNLRPGRVYGFSPVEQVLMTVNIALRRTTHQLEYYREGNQPEGVFGLPESWSPDQAMKFQDYWDSLFRGNLANRRTMKFVPAGSKSSYVPFKEPPLKTEYDEWLARICCFAFSYPPTALMTLNNRSIAEQHDKTGEEEGLEPTKQWTAECFTDIIAENFDSPDLEFCYVEEDEVDQEKQAEILTSYQESGALTINQVRDRIGEEPDENPAANLLMVMTKNGLVPIEANTIDAKVEMTKAMAEAMPAPEPTAGGNTPLKPKPATAKPASTKPQQSKPKSKEV